MGERLLTMEEAIEAGNIPDQYGLRRTWNAVLDVLVAGGLWEQVPAYLDDREGDLASSTFDSTLREAAMYITTGITTTVKVDLYKTTKTHGTVRSHQSGYVYLQDHKIKAQHWDRASPKVLAEAISVLKESCP